METQQDTSTVAVVGAQSGAATEPDVRPPASDGGTASFSPKPAAEPESPTQRAMARAKQNLKISTSEASEQAGSAQPAASTQGANTTDQQDGTATSGQDQQPAASTAIKAPDAWPEQWRQGFDALPEQARSIVLDINKSMQSGFTKAMQALGDRGRLADEYASHQENFARDPKAFLRQLAADAKLEVRFDDDPAPGEMPDFQNAAEMADWIAKQTELKLEAKQRAERDAESRAQQERQQREQVRTELARAAEAHPDFAEVRHQVFDVLAEHPGLPVEHAYRVASFERLAAQVSKLEKDNAELRTFKAQAERGRKALTVPVGGKSNGQPDASSGPQLSATERAMQRAKAKLASAA